MEATAQNKRTLLKDAFVTENPELDRLFGDRVFFPEKNKLAEEEIRKYGLPGELTERPVTD